MYPEEEQEQTSTLSTQPYTDTSITTNPDELMAGLSSQIDSVTKRREKALAGWTEAQTPSMTSGEMWATALLSILPTVAGAVEFGGAGAAMGAQAGASGSGIMINEAARQGQVRSQRAEQELRNADLDLRQLMRDKSTTQRQLSMQQMRDEAANDRMYEKERLMRGRPGKAGAGTGGGLFDVIDGAAETKNTLGGVSELRDSIREEVIPEPISSVPKPSKLPSAEQEEKKAVETVTSKPNVEEQTVTKYPEEDAIQLSWSELQEKAKTTKLPPKAEKEFIEIKKVARINPRLDFDATMPPDPDVAMKRVNPQEKGMPLIAQGLYEIEKAKFELDLARSRGLQGDALKAAENQARNRMMLGVSTIKNAQKELRNTGASTTAVEVDNFFGYSVKDEWLEENFMAAAMKWIDNTALGIKPLSRIPDIKRAMANEYNTTLKVSGYTPGYASSYSKKMRAPFLYKAAPGNEGKRTVQWLLDPSGVLNKPTDQWTKEDILFNKKFFEF